MFRKRLYSQQALETIADSYSRQSPIPLDEALLATTIAYSMAETVDTLTNLRILREDRLTYGGDNSDVFRWGVHNFGTLMAESLEVDNKRAEHYKKIAEQFTTLDEHTNRLGQALIALSNYLCANADMPEEFEVLREGILQFRPNAGYGGGDITFAADDWSPTKLFDNKPYLRLAEKAEWSGLFDLRSILELKVIGTALLASITPEMIAKMEGEQEFPDDVYSEVVKARKTAEAHLGYISKYHDIGKKCRRGWFTRLSQRYVDHQLNPRFARFAGAYGLVTGAASLVLGVPQLIHWVSSGNVDLTYTPVIPIELANLTALLLTSYGLSALGFGALTLGSDIGSSLMRDFRNLRLYRIEEVDV